MSPPLIERSGSSLRSLPSELSSESSSLTRTTKGTQTPSLQEAYWNGELGDEACLSKPCHFIPLQPRGVKGSELPRQNSSDVKRFLERHAQEETIFSTLSSQPALPKAITSTPPIEIKVLSDAPLIEAFRLLWNKGSAYVTL